jgi:hypothetical protein
MATSTSLFPIQPGDILLFRGHSFVSRAIRLIDGADVNHAALAVNASTMIEAAGSGLRLSPIPDAIAGNDMTFIHRLPGREDLSPVVAAGDAFLKARTPYAYQQLMLLALLTLTRRVELHSRLLRAIVRVACDQAARMINALVDDGRDLMICSEFVYRCFDDGHDPRYHLTLNDGWRATIPLPLAAGAEQAVIAEWAQAREEPTDNVEPADVKPVEPPEAIAIEAEAELEPLIAAYLTDHAAVDAAPAAAVAEATIIPDVDDDALHRSALALRDSFLRARQDRTEMAPASLLHPWRRFAHSTSPVADFITPGDLRHMTPIREERALPPT